MEDRLSEEIVRLWVSLLAFGGGQFPLKLWSVILKGEGWYEKDGGVYLVDSFSTSLAWTQEKLLKSFIVMMILQLRIKCNLPGHFLENDSFRQC